MSDKLSFWRPFMKSLASQGESANASFRALQTQGLKIRRQDYLREYATYKATVQKAPLIRNIRKEYFISSGMHSPAPPKQRKKYSYGVMITGYDENMSRSVRFMTTVSSSVPLRIFEQVENAWRVIEDVMERSGIEFTGGWTETAHIQPY